MLDLDDFLGEWRMVRVIVDAHAGQDGHFGGVARYTTNDSGLHYHEEGRLRLGDGPAMVATRDYHWTRDGDGIAVLFADGRPFHRFAATTGTAGADHLCGADLYRVAYDFADWPNWSSDWTVTGPAKSYRMRTAYSRA